MAIYNNVNGKDLVPMGKQKKYLLDLLNTESCTIKGSDWNGYGYTNKTRYYTLTRSQLIAFNKLKPKEIVKKPKKTNEEIEIEWAKRLAKLTDISVEDAKSIAREKQNYKIEKINEMIDKNCDRYSRMRDRLISKMERENPLRRIKDVEHARAILIAHDRHTNSNYESLLEEGRELAKFGEIERGEVKEFARSNFW
jgi:hypothetical protein